jgi:diaminopimelate epimerase
MIVASQLGAHSVHFVKMHGIGNDYVYVDAVSRPELEQGDLPELARRISDRHRGVGSDGLILLCAPRSEGHVRMRMWNADGSESEMCGNGIRCVAKFAHDRLGMRPRPLRVETGRGVLAIDYTTEGGKLVSATVDMGEPILELERIPVDPARVKFTGRGYEIEEFPTVGDWTFVSMGNPHAVSWEMAGSGEQSSLALQHRARLAEACSRIERLPAFPRRMNVHLVQSRSRREADMVTWERGSGFTQACGTGACAVLVAGVLQGRLDREALLHLPGGDLTIRWDEQSNHVFKTGPATEVFEGEWPD